MRLQLYLVVAAKQHLLLSWKGEDDAIRLSSENDFPPRDFSAIIP
jgi:hypothetical protein